MSNLEDAALPEWQIAKIKEGIAAADRGDIIPHEQVKACAASLGTDHPLPRPKP